MPDRDKQQKEEYRKHPLANATIRFFPQNPEEPRSMHTTICDMLYIGTRLILGGPRQLQL